jgi:hypothetical protein
MEVRAHRAWHRYTIIRPMKNPPAGAGGQHLKR